MPERIQDRESDIAPAGFGVGGPVDNALPPGMRDLLPAEAKFQSRVGRDLMLAFELFGYDRVWLPTFEFAELLERSRGLTGALRFIEPETGEVVALRSDMTPQIARVVATRFAAAPRPVRLCYQGSVVRRRRERARTESQVVQAGAELIGSPGPSGDFEVIELSCHAVRAAGLSDFVLDLGHAGIATRLMQSANPRARAELKRALGAKDHAELERCGRRAGLSSDTLAALVRLPDLHGGDAIWSSARQILGGTAAASEVEELFRLWQSACRSELAPSVLVDLGETRELEYYTGPVFQLLAHGPGEPVASGGRYDALYRRFGLESAAAGVALDLNHLCWALQGAGVVQASRPRVVFGATVQRELATCLRARGLCCAVAEQPRAYASHWLFEFLIEREGQLRLTHLPTNQELELGDGAIETMAGAAATFIERVVGDRSRT